MYKICKTERSANRQKLIENTLFEMMKKRHFDDITVTDLCEELKMPRKAFYRYFDGKDAALMGFIARNLSSYSDTYTATHGARSLFKELEEFFTFWETKSELLEVLNRSGKLMEVMRLSLEVSISSMVNLDRLLPDEEESMRERVYRFAIGGLVSIMLDWFEEGFKTPKSDITKLAVRILTKPPFPSLSKIGISDV
ncbi:MAG: TetR/AcrR family transcriptional regulator [Clostridia bacterium]|nr:TetR/AcrR family transcriptional regulator [Clostridia bacterium]